MKTLLTAILAVSAASVPALSLAGPLADALSRHGDPDVAALRGKREDVATRCTLGAVYAQRGDLSRAALYLEGCDDATLPDDVASSVARIDRDVKKRLRDSDLAMIEVVTRPDSMTGSIDALPGETFTTPATLYLKPGDYTIKANKNGLVLETVVHAVKRSRGAVLLESVARTAPVAKNGTVDFTEENSTEAPTVGGPKDIKHKNMMATKYQRGFNARAEPTAVANAEPNPDAIDDPMVVVAPARAPRPFWLGLRVGGGMFDDGSAAARAGIAVAATGRLPLAGRTFLAGRVDWSRRGSVGTDTIGASAGVGANVLDNRTLGVALIAQLRGDLRIGDVMMNTSRGGVAAAAGVEIALPRTPFSAGIRFEQGLTTLVPGVRDRALLVEVGVDWR